MSKELLLDSYVELQEEEGSLISGKQEQCTSLPVNFFYEAPDAPFISILGSLGPGHDAML